MIPVNKKLDCGIHVEIIDDILFGDEFFSRDASAIYPKILVSTNERPRFKPFDDNLWKRSFRGH